MNNTGHSCCQTSSASGSMLPPLIHWQRGRILQTKCFAPTRPTRGHVTHDRRSEVRIRSTSLPRERRVPDFETNKICSGGTGPLLEEPAERLGTRIVEEFCNLASRVPGSVRSGHVLHGVYGIRVSHSVRHPGYPQRFQSGSNHHPHLRKLRSPCSTTSFGDVCPSGTNLLAGPRCVIPSATRRLEPAGLGSSAGQFAQECAKSPKVRL